MLIDCKQCASSQLYFILIQTIIPRPIAWVLSDNGNESYNLAPFSFFNAIASNPPVLMISVGWKDKNTRKDTWVNINERKKFVVHIPSGENAKDVAASSATLPHGISEANQLHLPLEKVEGQRLPRVKGPKAAFFCEKYAIHEIGQDPQALILGKINHIWLAEEMTNDNKGRLNVDPQQLNPLARLGGNHYALLGDILTIQRPE